MHWIKLCKWNEMPSHKLNTLFLNETQKWSYLKLYSNLKTKPIWQLNEQSSKMHTQHTTWDTLWVCSQLSINPIVSHLEGSLQTKWNMLGTTHSKSYCTHLNSTNITWLWVTYKEMMGWFEWHVVIPITFKVRQAITLL